MKTKKPGKNPLESNPAPFHADDGPSPAGTVKSLPGGSYLEGMAHFSVLIAHISLFAVLVAILARSVQLWVLGAFAPGLLAGQLLLWAAHAGFVLLREHFFATKGMETTDWQAWIQLAVHLVLLATLGPMNLFFIPVMLPVAWRALTQGFGKTLPWTGAALGLQLVLQAVLQLPWMHRLGLPAPPSLLFQSAYAVMQYALYLFVFLLLGKAQAWYARSEEDNRLLVERLGDKYVQLEEARREMQIQYDRLRVANEQTEDSNRKLTASLAEFFTIQQISQAISSIFDMNELLRFVNDVIIGVMGVANSTIAMKNRQSGRMKVLVSSIIDKRELAVFTDYINHDIQNGSVSTTAAVLDNAVTQEAYRFIQGRNVRSIVSVPLIAKGNPLGIVLVEQVIPDAFSNETVRLLEIIAQQISIAIDNARLYQQMQEMATIDGLTGAYNRIHFQNTLQEAFLRAKSGGGELSMLMFDIDHFKRFNDTHGHQFGDLVLKTLSAFVMEKLRKTDLFARYGGEEFVILMPHTTRQQAYDKAEELRRGIEKLPVSSQQVTASVTVSIGVSTYPDTADTEVALIKAADDAMYEAKNAGRNLVRLAGTLSEDDGM